MTSVSYNFEKFVISESATHISCWQVTTLNELPEKPPPTTTGECELVQSPVHVPTTFAAPKEESIKNSTTQVNENGQS